MPRDHSQHGHSRAHIDPEAGDRRVIAAIAINPGLTVAQIAAGNASGPLASIAAAVHDLSDTLSIAFAARRIARKPSDARMAFVSGRERIEAVPRERFDVADATPATEQPGDRRPASR